jgi:hypothetical protein
LFDLRDLREKNLRDLREKYFGKPSLTLKGLNHLAQGNAL